MAITLKDIADLADHIEKFLPAPVAAPVSIVSMILRDADDVRTKLTDTDLARIQANAAQLGAAAGAAANKASHLAGLREAIERLVRSNVGFAAPLDTAATRAQLTDAIMAEVAKRFP